MSLGVRATKPRDPAPDKFRRTRSRAHGQKTESHQPSQGFSSWEQAAVTASISYLCWRPGWIPPAAEQRRETMLPAFCLLGARQERRRSSTGVQMYREQDGEKESLQEGCQGEDPHTSGCGRHRGSLQRLTALETCREATSALPEPPPLPEG